MAADIAVKVNFEPQAKKTKKNTLKHILYFSSPKPGKRKKNLSWKAFLYFLEKNRS